MTAPPTTGAAAQWPDGEGPYVFLLDSASKLETLVLKEWIERNRPRGASIVTARIPSSRRLTQQRLDPRLGARLVDRDDPLLVPLRVVWLAKEADGRRRVRLKDVLIWGDPRDPNPLRQRWIKTTEPERCRVVVGAPARKSDLTERWRNPSGHGPADGTSLEEYVSLQAWLALERAERRLRGNRYKVPKFLREDLYWSRGFQLGVADLALRADEPLKKTQARAARYLREIAATHSPYVIDVVTAVVGALIRGAHRRLVYDPEELFDRCRAGERHPIVFLPSHKSNFDHLVLSFVLYENALPQNHTAGGINMNFFPVGPFLRRTGVFFIRREFKDNDVYKLVLRKYIEYLMEKRFALEWYVEGGRSRTGKMREPRLGLLAYVAESYIAGFVDDIVLVPVALQYDQITDVLSYAREQQGGDKERESFRWALKFIAAARRPHGSVYLRFGTPVRMSSRVEPGMDLTTPEGRLAVPRLAFDVSRRVNDVIPITPVSLVSLALLARGGAATAAEITEYLEPYVDYIARRGLPVTRDVAGDGGDSFRQALEELAVNGSITRSAGPTETLYRLELPQHYAVAYYRNTIVHHFLDRSIAEVCFDAVGSSGMDSVRAAAFGARDLLKFEFFFAPRDEYFASIARELAELGSVRLAPAIVGAFMDSYQVVADVIAAAGEEARAAPDVVDAAMELGRQYLQRRSVAPESVSIPIYTSAVEYAAHRGLLSGTEEERRDFADEMTWIRTTIAGGALADSH